MISYILIDISISTESSTYITHDVYTVVDDHMIQQVMGPVNTSTGTSNPEFSAEITLFMSMVLLILHSTVPHGSVEVCSVLYRFRYVGTRLQPLRVPPNFFDSTKINLGLNFCFKLGSECITV